MNHGTDGPSTAQAFARAASLADVGQALLAVGASVLPDHALRVELSCSGETWASAVGAGPTPSRREHTDPQGAWCAVAADGSAPEAALAVWAAWQEIALARLSALQQDRLFHLFVGADEPVASVDADGRVTYWSTGLAQWLGVPASAARRGPFVQHVSGRHRAAVQVALDRLLAGVEATRSVEAALHRADGTEEVVDLRLRRVQDAPDAVSIVVRTLSGHYRSQQEQARAEAETRRLTGALVRIGGARNDDFAAFERFVTALVAEILEVDRVSLWAFHGDHIALSQLYEARTGEHETGLLLREQDFPDYFRAMRTQESIVASDALTHPDTRAFRTVYLEPLGIHSMLDVPLQALEGLRGVLCIESRASRSWRPSEVGFCKDVASLVVQAGDRATRKAIDARQAAVLASIAEAVVACDLEGRITVFNPAAARLTGRTALEVSGQPLDAVIALSGPSGSASILDALRQVLAGGPSVDGVGECSLLRADGSRLSVAEHLAPVWADGRVVGAVLTLRDLTDAQRSQREIARQHQHLRSISEAIPDLLFTVLFDGRVRYLQRSSELGERPSADGRVVTDLFPRDAAHQLLLAAGRALDSGELQTFEYQTPPDDGARWCEVRVARLSDDEATVLVRDVTEDRAQRQSLAESQAQLSALLAASSAVIYAADVPALRLDYVSDSVQTLLGRTAAEVRAVGSWITFVHPDDRDRVQQGVASALSGAPAVLEYRVIRPDGSSLWLRDELRRSSPDARGGTHLVGAAVDVTARRQDEESLQALNLELLRRTERQRAMLDLSAEMARASSLDQLLATVSGQLRPVLGAARVSIAERVPGGGARLTQVVQDSAPAQPESPPPMSREQLARMAIGAALATGAPVSTRTAPVEAYSDWTWLRERFGYHQFAVVPLVGSDGPFGTLNVAFGDRAPLTSDEVEWVAQFGSTLAAHLVSHRAVDALERLNSDLEARVSERTRELTESESRFHLLFQYAPQAMLMIDGDGRVAQSNQAADALFGVDAQGLLGRPVASLLPDGEPTEDGGARRGVRADGSAFFAEVGKVPIALRGVPHELAGIADITDRVTAQGQLVRSLRDKETLLQEIHHRVKNNLQIISSLLQLQSDEMPSEEARKVILESVFRVRSMALIHQQLYGVESLAHIDFGEYARTLGRSLGSTLAPHARLVVDATPVELTVDVAVPLGLILNELLTNAFKYGLPQGPRLDDWDVRVAVRLEDDRVSVEVCDRGPGLPGSFDPERSQSLGLHLVRSLIRQLRGHLTWTNARAGACLSFTCPRVLT